MEATNVWGVFDNPVNPHSTCAGSFSDWPTVPVCESVMFITVGASESMETRVLTVYGHSGAI